MCACNASIGGILGYTLGINTCDAMSKMSNSSGSLAPSTGYAMRMQCDAMRSYDTNARIATCYEMHART